MRCTHLRNEAEEIDGEIIRSESTHEVDDESVDRREGDVAREVRQP